MSSPGWVLVILGLVLAAVGVLWLLLPSVPWLGRLPGDIVIEKPNVHIYIPIATSIVLSVLLSGVIWLVHHFSR